MRKYPNKVMHLAIITLALILISALVIATMAWMMSIAKANAHRQATASASAHAENTNLSEETGQGADSTLDTSANEQASALVVHYIDVGQGSATLVTCDGCSMLIDGGKRSKSDLIYSYLKKQGISNLQYIVATHPDEDHIGGLAGALNYATALEAFSPVTEHDTKTFQNFTKYLHKQGVLIHVPVPGQKMQLGSAEVTILGPVIIDEQGETNNNSIVIRVDFGETSFLFMGDAEVEEEETLLQTYDRDQLKCDVVLVGHHGSSSSTSEDFLQSVSPSYAVISVGKENTYGHPTPETLEKLKRLNIVAYRTDLNGDIVCESDGHQIWFSLDSSPVEIK